MTTFINWQAKQTETILHIKPHDYQLINLLSENSRLSLSTIGKKLHISPAAVSKKITTLEKKKIITGYSAFIDFGKLGFSYYNIGLKVNMTIDEQEKYMKRIEALPFVNNILTFRGGRWDFLIRIITKELNSS